MTTTKNSRQKTITSNKRQKTTQKVDKRPSPATGDKEQPEIVDKGSPLATRDKRQSEKADKRPSPITRDEKRPETANKRPPLAIKDNGITPIDALLVSLADTTGDNKRLQTDASRDNGVPPVVVARARLIILCRYLSTFFFFLFVRLASKLIKSNKF